MSQGQRSGPRLTRRRALGALAAILASSTRARAFGQGGAFHPRLLTTAGGVPLVGPRSTAPGRWGWELERRTSAPARLASESVAADQPRLLAEPLVLWAGSRAVEPLTASECGRLEQYLRLGGLVLVDDSAEQAGAFARSAERELARVLPESSAIGLGAEHVIYKAFYLLDRPVGRVLGPPSVRAIVRGQIAQVLFLQHDLLGALAPGSDGGWALPVEPGGALQREQAVRFAVNLAMYVLCSDYKDDQVHVPEIMRRRARRAP